MDDVVSYEAPEVLYVGEAKDLVFGTADNTEIDGTNGFRGSVDDDDFGF